MAAIWWKFTLGGTGTHLVRATGLGTGQHQIWLDGVLLEAPPGTTLFTGPAAALMELQQTAEGYWSLMVEGTPAEPYNPESGPVETPAVAWWKFPLQGMGTHHLRVLNIGSAEQVVFLDGTPLEAPAGTLTFTGPAASLLELRQQEGLWVLAADGVIHHQHNPAADGDGRVHVWNFALPTGVHQLRVTNIGTSAQDIVLDSVRVAAPPDTTTFTGPAASLLELERRGDGWALLVDGVEASASDQSYGAAEACWTFIAPQTGTAHQMRVSNIGRPGQEVFIDGTHIPAPEGTTTFTGPGGAFLEIRPLGHAWSLFVDGVGVEDYNARSSIFPPPGAALGEQRGPVDVGGSLPQGVSYDSEAGIYKANIKVKGRFRHLGDFATAVEAHERYLKAKQEFEST